jgi:hypothetical protein
MSTHLGGESRILLAQMALSAGRASQVDLFGLAADELLKLRFAGVALVFIDGHILINQ